MKHFCLLLIITSAAWAQAALSLKEAVREALASHPLLAASAARVAASEGLRTQAALRPNPRFILQTENLRAWGAPSFSFSQEADAFAYVSQLVETAGKRARRVEAASANLVRAGLERELLARQIAARVKLAYWIALAAEKGRDLLEENAKTFQQMVEYHELRVREGAMAEADLLRIRLEAERLALDASSAALAADRACIQLLREMGRVQFDPVAFSEPLESLGDLPPPDPARALQDRTEMKLARTAVEQNRALLRLQQAAWKPDLDFSFGYKRATGFDTLLGGVSVDLPAANRNQGNITAAEREVRAAEADLAAAEALVRAEVAAALRDFEIRRRQVLQALPSLRDKAQDSSRISLAAYRVGGTDLLRLLDSERTRIEVQLLYFRTLADYQQSRVALETALGVAP